jgi:hypothetical protein
VHILSAYGLTIASALPLPGLASGSGGADVFVDFGAWTDVAASDDRTIRCVGAEKDKCRLAWGGVGELLVEGGSRIVVLPMPNADEASLALFVLGPGLGVLLHQRGLLVLHGSCVAMGGRGIGFLGQKGWGKSTTAGALARLGHALISDELLAIRFDSNGLPWVLPAASPIKLWSDAFSSLCPEDASPLRVRPGIDKFYLPAICAADREYPLGAVYILDEGEGLTVHPVLGTVAFFDVLPNLYVTRFGTPFLQASGSASNVFRQLDLLLGHTRIIRLLREQSLDRLEEIAALIESECLDTHCWEAVAEHPDARHGSDSTFPREETLNPHANSHH